MQQAVRMPHYEVSMDGGSGVQTVAKRLADAQLVYEEKREGSGSLE